MCRRLWPRRPLAQRCGSTVAWCGRSREAAPSLNCDLTVMATYWRGWSCRCEISTVRHQIRTNMSSFLVPESEVRTPACDRSDCQRRVQRALESCTRIIELLVPFRVRSSHEGEPRVPGNFGIGTRVPRTPISYTRRKSNCELRLQKGTRIIELLLSLDSEARRRVCCEWLRTSESGH